MIFQVSSFRKLFWIYGLVLLIPVKQQLNPNQPGLHHVTSSIFDSQFVLICPFPDGYAVDVYTCMYIVYTCMYTHTHIYIITTLHHYVPISQSVLPL